MGSSHMNAAELSNWPARRYGSPDVQAELLEFSRTVSAWQTPSEVLDALNLHSWKRCSGWPSAPNIAARASNLPVQTQTLVLATSGLVRNFRVCTQILEAQRSIGATLSGHQPRQIESGPAIHARC